MSRRRTVASGLALRAVESKLEHVAQEQALHHLVCVWLEQARDRGCCPFGWRFDNTDHDGGSACDVPRSSVSRPHTAQRRCRRSSSGAETRRIGWATQVWSARKVGSMCRNSQESVSASPESRRRPGLGRGSAEKPLLAVCLRL